jgi:hypothetical protein
MPDRNSLALSTDPIVIEQVDLVRVEKSLHSLGFFSSTASKEISRTTMQVFRRPDGQKIQAKAIIEGIPRLGLPTTADRDKYMAFMKIALDKREMHGQLSNPVCFTGADMIKLLRLRKGGFHYDEINDWCKRMVATTIMSESSIFLADRRQYVSDTFHVFDRVVLVGEELNDGTRSEFYRVYLSHWQLTNLNQGYLLPLDFNAYLKLKRDISKGLFGHLSVWFYASRGQCVEKRYDDFCRLLGIRAYPHLSKARSVLEPSFQELMDIGYLSSWELTRTARGSDFKLVLSPGERLLSLPNFVSIVNPDARATLEARLPAWVGTLIEHGVAERKARQLALDISNDQPVADQIEYAEYLIQQDRSARGKISNPAGFFIWAIENNLSIPEHFETSRKRTLRDEQRSSQRDGYIRELQLETEYAEYCQSEIQAHLEEQYQGEKLEAALREHLKVVRREQPEWYTRTSDATRREVAFGRLKAAIRESIQLPAFEVWKSHNTQQRLF